MLNWDWTIGSCMGLNSTGEAHSVAGVKLQRHFLNSLRTADGLIDFDKAVKYNNGEAVEGLLPMQNPKQAGKSVSKPKPGGGTLKDSNQCYIMNGSVN